MIANCLPGPNEPRYVYPLIRVKPDEPLTVIWATDCWLGIRVHWNGQRNVICYGEQHCLHCKNSIPIFQAWAIIERLSDNAPGLIQLSANVSEMLGELLEHERGVRGRICTFRRAGSRKNSPLIGKALGFKSPKNPRSVFDLEVAVERIFKQPLRKQAVIDFKD